MTQFGHTAWRVQDGFFNGSPWSLAQTPDGYLWIGTDSQLLKFDGVRFLPWAPPVGQQLPAHFVSALAIGRHGDLWIGTGNGLSHWDNRKLTNSFAGFGFIKSIYEDPDGSVWVTHVVNPPGFNGDLCHLTGATINCFADKAGIPSDDIPGTISMVVDAHQAFWLGTGRSILRGTPGSFQRFAPRELAKGQPTGVIEILPMADGSAWVGMGKSGPGLGLQRLMGDQWKAFVLPDFDSSKLSVSKLLLDRDGALWIGTLNQGLYRIHGGSVDHFGTEDGLSGNRINSLYEDHEGSVWVATSNGLDRFRDLPVVTFSSREGLGDEGAFGVVASRSGAALVGLGNGLVTLREGRISSTPAFKDLPHGMVTSMLEDHAGKMWIGIDDGLFTEKGGKFVRVTRPDGSPLGMVMSIVEDEQNNIWIEHKGRPKGLVLIREGRVEEVFPPPEVISARELAADPGGGIWAGAAGGGLAHYKDGKLETYPADPGPDHFGARQIIAAPQGWVLAALGSGLMIERDGKAQVLTSKNGLPCNNTYAVVLDGRGYLWLYSECGLTTIAISEIEKWWGHPDLALKIKSFDANDGVRPGRGPFQLSARTTDGKLWFVNGSVLQMIDPGKQVANSVAPPVHVEGILADRELFPDLQNIRLPALTHDLEIDYTALSLVNPQRVRFRYRLDGYDTDWKDAGTRRAAFYTNLGPGTYTFRVIACNNDGVWNEKGDALGFVLRPAFFQTIWFEALCVVFFFLLLWAIYRLRVRTATEQVRGRLTAQLAERERIARELHDTLLQGFQGLVLRFQGAIKQIPDQEPSRQLMMEALDRADEALLEGRNRVRDLRSEAATVNELSESLRACIEELAQDYPIEATVTEVGTRQPLHPIVRDEAYRIGREALTNALRHSKAAKIEAEIIYQSESVRLRIRDDGDGIDQSILNDGRSGHWGISGMRERAEKIGGQFSIWSSPGAGTEIDLAIPAKVAYHHNEKRPPLGWIKRAAGREGEGCP